MLGLDFNSVKISEIDIESFFGGIFCDLLKSTHTSRVLSHICDRCTVNNQPLGPI